MASRRTSRLRASTFPPAYKRLGVCLRVCPEPVLANRTKKLVRKRQRRHAHMHILYRMNNSIMYHLSFPPRFLRPPAASCLPLPPPRARSCPRRPSAPRPRARIGRAPTEHSELPLPPRLARDHVGRVQRLGRAGGCRPARPQSPGPAWPYRAFYRQSAAVTVCRGKRSAPSLPTACRRKLI